MMCHDMNCFEGILVFPHLLESISWWLLLFLLVLFQLWYLAPLIQDSVETSVKPFVLVPQVPETLHIFQSIFYLLFLGKFLLFFFKCNDSPSVTPIFSILLLSPIHWLKKIFWLFYFSLLKFLFDASYIFYFLIESFYFLLRVFTFVCFKCL